MENAGKDYRLDHRIAYLTTSTIWNQIVQNHHRRLVEISHESSFLSHTAESDEFTKLSRRTERYPLIQSIQKSMWKKEVFKEGDKIYTREKPSETSESVLTGYGVMSIMPNQESEWIHQVVRNIPSSTLSIQWDNSDSEVEKKREQMLKYLRQIGNFSADLVEGFANNKKGPNQEHSLFTGPKINFDCTSPKTM